MDIGEQKRVIMVEPLSLSLDEQLELLGSSEQRSQQPQGGHAGDQHPGQRPATPANDPADGEGDELDPTRTT